jgi:hypothetical protein
MRIDPLTSPDIEGIISLCLTEPGCRSRRDAALFALVWCGQLSIPEAVRLSPDGANRIIGPCGSVFAHAVQCWAAIRPQVPGPFLLTIGRRGKIEAEAMPATTASEVIRRRAAEAKVGYVTPQELLRSAVLASRLSQRPASGAAIIGPCDDPGAPLTNACR